MNKRDLTLIVSLLAGTAFGTDYSITTGDAANGASWSPNASGIISGLNVNPLVGDRLLYNFTNNTDQIGNASANINIVAGSEIRAQGNVGGGQDGNNRAIRPHLFLAGTGTDGLGAFKNAGNGGWVQVSDVNIMANTTVSLTGGGWRHDNHGTGFNALNLNGNTLTVTGNQGMWLVNTVVTGSGVIDVQSTGYADNINFEGASVLPADVTLKLANGTLHSSWDGAGRVMAGNVEAAGGAVIEGRYNDLGKTYAGQITLTGGGTSFRTTDSGGGGGSLVINGKVTGPGELVKDGGASVDLGTTRGMVTLNNPANDYTGGTRVESGRLRLGAAGAIPHGRIDVNGGTLDLNGNTQLMTHGTLQAEVVGAGSTLGITGPGVTVVRPGANVQVPVEVSGGILQPNHDLGDNVLGNGLTSTVLFSGNATLKPYQAPATIEQPGLHEFHRTGAGVGADLGTTGATYTGIQQGIPAIDSTAKPYGDNNSFVYTGVIRNTSGGPMAVSFAEQYDDEIRVKVNGTTVLLDTAWNVATQSGSVTLNSGDNIVEFTSYDGTGGAGPNSGWTKGIGLALGVPLLDNANYGVISNSTMPAGLALVAPVLDNRQDRSENKNLEIDPGVTLTVDTTDLQGKAYTLTGVLSGGGNMTKTGLGDLIISGISSYTGKTTISQGTLKLSATGSIASSNEVDVAAGAVLDGSASGFTVPLGQKLDGNGTVIGNTTINGTISPGNSVGTLTINGSLTINGAYTAEASANGVNDFVNASGGVTWGAGSSFTLSLLGGYSPAWGDSFDFLDTTIAGSAPSMNLPSLSGGMTWDQSQFMSNGVLTVIPEPTTSVIAMLAALGLLYRRRR